MGVDCREHAVRNLSVAGHFEGRVLFLLLLSKTLWLLNKILMFHSVPRIQTRLFGPLDLFQLGVVEVEFALFVETEVCVPYGF